MSCLRVRAGVEREVDDLGMSERKVRGRMRSEGGELRARGFKRATLHGQAESFHDMQAPNSLGRPVTICPRMSLLGKPAVAPRLAMSPRVRELPTRRRVR